MNTHLWRYEENGTISPHGHLPMRDAYFAPERVKREGGIDPLFRGAVRQAAQEIDLKVCKCKEILSRRSDFCPFCGLSGTGEANNRLIRYSHSMLRRIFFRANLEYNFMEANLVSSFFLRSNTFDSKWLFFTLIS